MNVKMSSNIPNSMNNIFRLSFKCQKTSHLSSNCLRQVTENTGKVFKCFLKLPLCFQ